MSQWPALDALKIGCVQYLNSKPLILPYEDPVRFAHPSELGRMLAAGDLDAALIPIFESLKNPAYRLVDGVSISSKGPVYSVFLAWKGPLARVRRVGLDPASRTSAHLVQVVLAEFYGMKPEFVPDSEEEPARLLIGNQAIQFRQQHRGEFHFMDLGEEWRMQTGLPMVFAAWAIRPESASPAVAESFRQIAAAGRTRIDEIAAAEPDPKFARHYLTEFVRFDLGAEEKEGIRKYSELLNAHVEPTQFQNTFI